MKWKTLLLMILLSASSARADVVGLISNLLATAATDAELEETVLDLDSVVINASDRHDLRIGDGVTPGGVRVWNTDALTNPPTSFPLPIAMNGNAVALNGSYQIGAEGPLFYLRCNGSNVLSVIAMAEGLGTIISEEYAGSNTLRVLIAVEDAAADPLVQYSTSLVTPVWTDCVYTVTRPTTNTVQLDIDIPEDATNGYYQITSLSGFRVRFSVPVEIDQLDANTLTLGGVARTNWPDGGGSTFTNVGFGLTGTGDATPLAVDTSLVATGTPLYAYTETDPAFTSWTNGPFQAAVTALVESVAVTNASVLSYNGTNLTDGAIALDTDDFGWDGSTLTVTASGGTPTDPYTAYTNIPITDGTATISRTDGKLVLVTQTTAPIAIEFATNYPPDGISQIWMTLVRVTNSFSFNTNQTDGSEAFLGIANDNSTNDIYATKKRGGKWSFLQDY
jgi:hypothetical protein